MYGRGIQRKGQPATALLGLTRLSVTIKPLHILAAGGKRTARVRDGTPCSMDKQSECNKEAAKKTKKNKKKYVGAKLYYVIGGVDARWLKASAMWMFTACARRLTNIRNSFLITNV